MTFEEIWQNTPLGTRLRVTDGKPEPSGQEGLPWRLWRSHNFDGEFVDKIAGPPRALQIRLDESGGSQIAYTVSETVEHEFTQI